MEITAMLYNSGETDFISRLVCSTA